MKHRYFRIFWVWDYDEEERWLNEMSAKGLQLEKVSLFLYTFTEGEPNEYCYRLQLLAQSPVHADSEAYLAFLEEAGIDNVAQYNDWVYLRKRNDGKLFEIFSDTESRIKHLRRMRTPTLIGAALMALMILINLIPFSNISGVDIGAFLLCAVMFFLILRGFFKINKKIHQQQKEQTLHE